jgi:signal transduction histidine kinase
MSQNKQIPPVEAATPVGHPLSDNLSILLVANGEDTLVLERAVRAALSGSTNIALADCLVVARSYMTRTRFDAILLQLSLPDSDGLNTAVVMLQEAAGMPIILIADGEAEEALAAKAMRYGAEGYIIRDQITVDLLAEGIATVIERQARRQAPNSKPNNLEVTASRYLSLIANNADGIIVVDKKGILRFANPAAEEMLQRPLSELEGEPFGIPLDGVDRMEVDMLPRDGRRCITEMHVVETLWDDENAYLATLRDISSRKQAEGALGEAKQAAERANNMKSQFLASMTHELRTPLNAIIGFSEIIRSEMFGPLSNTRYKGYIEDIHDGGTQLLRLINDLLDLAKAEAGKLELREEEFDLVETIQAAVRQIGPRATQGKVTVTTELCIDSLRVSADVGRVKQILLNLLSNAVKFTPEGGQVRIGARTASTGAPVITVADTGIGIPNDQIPRAFAAFSQVENASLRVRGEGTGLGLSLVRRLVELHGGSIKLSSEVGLGTVVTVTLPAHRRVDGVANENIQAAIG